MRNLRLTALLTLIPVLAACGQIEVVDRDAQGRPILIRAPQPSEDDIQELKQAHDIKTVLNLRGEHPGKGWYEEEGAAVQAVGARWEHIKANSARPPTPAELDRFYQLVEDPQARPILMHCQGGIHRTGIYTAVYRIRYQGWSNEDALADMEDHYFNWGVTDRSRAKDFVRRYKPPPKKEE